jgi:metallo-beta-lactamase class B
MKKKLATILIFLIVTLPEFSQSSDDIRLSQDLRLHRVSDNVWIHISDIVMKPWGKVDANGLAVLCGSMLVLVDTPWNDGQTEKLVEWFKKNHAVQQVTVIIGHYHQDNLGGLGWINRQGYDSWSLKRTKEICFEKNLPAAKNTWEESKIFSFGDFLIEAYFPGSGHTEDSVCAYLKNDKILFGGCSVKSLASKTLGNTAEADLAAWPDAIRSMKNRFADAEIIIPGHGPEGGPELLDHTLKLLRNGGH